MRFFNLPVLPCMDEFMEIKNSFGVDKLSLMLKIMIAVESRPSKLTANVDRIKAHIVQQLKRGFMPGEHEALCGCLLAYLESEPGTEQRINALLDLVNMKFMRQQKANA